MATTLKEMNLPVEGMTCAACAVRIEKMVGKLDGVQEVQVNLASERAHVVIDPSTSWQAVVERIEKTGYQVPVESLSLQIGGMTCAACSARIEKVVGRLPGVQQIQVNLASEKGQVTIVPGVISQQDVIAAIAKAGYIASLIDDKAQQDRKRQKQLAYQKEQQKFALAVLLVLPLFVQMVLGLFGVRPFLPDWISFLLATPMQFYVGWRFYRGAYHALRGGSANMDVLVVLGTSVAYLYSVFLLVLGSTQTYFDSSALVITLITLGKLLETRAKAKSSAAVEELAKLGAKMAHRQSVDSETFEDVPVESLQVGDIVQVLPGEKIPSDGTILKGSTRVDQSFITGESMPVAKQVGDEVVGASVNQHQAFMMRIDKIGADTMLSQVIRLVDQAQGSKAPVQRLADQISGIFVPIVLGIAVITFLLWGLFLGWSHALFAAVAVLVVACPCSLGLATPTAIMVGTGLGAKKGILIKGGEYLERLHHVQSVIFDKTGTLTVGHPEVSAMWVAEGVDPSWLVQKAASLEQQSEHPLGAAIVRYAKEQGLAFETFEEVRACPGQGIEGKVKGITYAIGHRQWLESKIDETVTAMLEDFEKKAFTAVVMTDEERALGVFGIADAIKPEAARTVAALHALGIETWLLTGDQAYTAQAVAQQVGITHVVAQVLPADKATKVAEIQAQGRIVAMVGDGINDAPALAKADIGIGMGTGSAIALEAADIALVNADTLGVVEAILLAKATMRKIHQNLFWAFFYNVLGIPLAAFGILSPIIAGAAMAMSSVSVVSNSLLLQRRYRS